MDGDVFALLTGGAKFDRKKYEKDFNAFRPQPVAPQQQPWGVAPSKGHATAKKPTQQKLGAVTKSSKKPAPGKNEKQQGKGNYMQAHDTHDARSCMDSPWLVACSHATPCPKPHAHA